MRQLKSYILQHKDEEKQLLTYRDHQGRHSVEISASVTDKVEVFREQGITYVLTWNAGRHSAGLRAFAGKDRVGDLFILAHQSNLEDILGKEGWTAKPLTIAKNLRKYLSLTDPTPQESPPAVQPPTDTRTFEIYLEDLTHDARQRYLTAVGGDPALGPLAILDFNQEEDDEKEA